MHAAVRHDYTPLSDRMNALLGLRVVMAGFVLVWAWVRPDVSAVPLDAVAALSFAYVAASLALEASRRRSGRRGLSVITGLLLADGVYLIGAMYLTGGTGSPLRFLVYLHLVAVSLLASYRTGLKLALWDSLLLLVVLYAQAAQLIPAVDVAPGQAIEFEQMPIAQRHLVLAVRSRDVRVLGHERARASPASRRSPGARRRRRSPRRRDRPCPPVATSCSTGLVDRFGFPRGVVLGSVDDQMIILASQRRRQRRPRRRPFRTRSSLVRWERREILAVDRWTRRSIRS